MAVDLEHFSKQLFMHLFLLIAVPCENGNKIGPKAFSLALGPQNDNNIHRDRHFLVITFLALGDLEIDFSAENKTIKYFTITILSPEVGEKVKTVIKTKDLTISTLLTNSLFAQKRLIFI